MVRANILRNSGHCNPLDKHQDTCNKLHLMRSWHVCLITASSLCMRSTKHQVTIDDVGQPVLESAGRRCIAENTLSRYTDWLVVWRWRHEWRLVTINSLSRCASRTTYAQFNRCCNNLNFAVFCNLAALKYSFQFSFIHSFIHLFHRLLGRSLVVGS